LILIRYQTVSFQEAAVVRDKAWTVKRGSWIVLLAALACSLPAPVQAQAAPSGADTVADARVAEDYSYVTLTGRIIAHNTNNEQGRTDLYTFTDDRTGNIIVVIERSLIHGKEVTEGTRIRISGEVDRSQLQPRVRVHQLEVVGQ
jgi:uncharacterized protein (TIGR00156 family)